MRDYLSIREINQTKEPPKLYHYFDENELMENLHNSEILKGHDGCVNTLRWNRSGSLLASGSDDRKVIIWRAEREVHRIDTNHMANIFAVEFLPAKGDQMVLTGAGDHMVMMHHVEYGNDCSWQTDGRVKRLCTVEAEPFLCWCASEDSIIRQIDTRTNNIDNLVVREETRFPCKSIAISDAKPHLIGVAVASCRTEIPIYDRRNVSQPVITLLQYDHAGRGSYATHLAFDRTGNECVVNISDGDVLVFDLDKEKDPKVMESFHNLLGLKDVPIITKQEVGTCAALKRSKQLIENSKYSELIDFYGEQLAKKGSNPALRSIFYSSRAVGFLARRQRGDSYSCIRDCIKALQEHPGNTKALWRMGKAFSYLENWEDAKKCCEEARQRFPTENNIAKIEKGLPTPPLGNAYFRIKNEEKYIDYKERYTGRSNCQTDIKEANFFGARDQYIVAGSDCGSLVMWNREKSNMLGMWKCDSNILNCVQPHPELPLLATSGIDHEIKLWQPKFGGVGEAEDDTDSDEDDRIRNPYDFDMYTRFRIDGHIERETGMMDCRTS